MKIRLNKSTLSEMPAVVANLVSAWKAQYGKAFISVENVTQFYPSEDARVTLFDLASGKSASATAAGDFAGYTNLSPNAPIPLMPGIVAVETGFFCGMPFLNLYQGSVKQITA